ncbi:MAG TPA: hypothetical protein VMI06_01875, partial [Terriglobia bacterium]|nr:hypothetical protein [Terriglobia bacterium]
MALNPITGDPLPSRLQKELPGVLPGYLQAQRWFGGKADAIRSVGIPEIIPIYAEGFSAYLLLVFVEYAATAAQTYALPLVPVSLAQGVPLVAGELIDPKLTLDHEDHKAFRDALGDRQFADWLLEIIHRGNR